MSKLRFLASYPRFGDPDPLFMDRVLQDAKAEGRILDFRVTDVLHNFGGFPEMEVIQFHVDVDASEGTPWWHTSFDSTKGPAEAMLNEIVGDSDVEVRYVGIPDPEAEAQREAALLEVVADSTWDRDG